MEPWDMENHESKAAFGGSKEDLRPTYDQLYLASRIIPPGSSAGLSLPALQKLNCHYGVAGVTAALRVMRGFPPTELRSAYAYLDAMCARMNPPRKELRWAE